MTTELFHRALWEMPSMSMPVASSLTANIVSGVGAPLERPRV